MLKLQSLALFGSELSRARDARIYFLNSYTYIVQSFVYFSGPDGASG